MWIDKESSKDVLHGKISKLSHITDFTFEQSYYSATTSLPQR